MEISADFRRERPPLRNGVDRHYSIDLRSRNVDAHSDMTDLSPAAHRMITDELRLTASRINLILAQEGL